MRTINYIFPDSSGVFGGGLEGLGVGGMFFPLSIEFARSISGSFRG
jgi:hypothetical protein